MYSENWKGVFLSVLARDSEVQQFVKCMISSTSHTHVRDLSRPIICQLDVTLIRFIYLDLGEGNLIFCCTGPTDPNFRQIKIIVLISHIGFVRDLVPNV